MYEALTIEAVASSFAKWRGTKRGHEAIPERLWEQVGALLQSYRVGEVLFRLRLSHGQLKAKGLIPLATRGCGLTPTTAFVEVPASSGLVAQPTPSTSSSALTGSSVPTPALTLTRGEVTLTFNQPTDAHVHTAIMACLWGAP